MCDTSLSNQRRYAPRVAEMTGLGGRFDRNTQQKSIFMKNNEIAMKEQGITMVP
jgi:hypothetical protein